MGNIGHHNDVVIFVIVFANLVVIGMYGRQAMIHSCCNEGCDIGIVSCGVLGSAVGYNFLFDRWHRNVAVRCDPWKFCHQQWV
jgi:hypothetical protein